MIPSLVLILLGALGGRSDGSDIGPQMAVPPQTPVKKGATELVSPAGEQSPGVIEKEGVAEGISGKLSAAAGASQQHIDAEIISEKQTAANGMSNGFSDKFAGNSMIGNDTLKPNLIEPVPKALREGRRLKRGVMRRLALPLLILLLVKAGLGLPVIFGGVALAAFKGLWTGSTAMLVSAALALRGLIPPPRIIIPPSGHHAHVTDYIAADYRRADDYRDDYNRYGSYGWK